MWQKGEIRSDPIVPIGGPKAAFAIARAIS